MLIRWHRKGFGLFWRWRSRRPGPTHMPADLRRYVFRFRTEAWTGFSGAQRVREKSCALRLACELFVAVTAGFKLLFVFVVIEVGSLRVAA